MSLYITESVLPTHAPVHERPTDYDRPVSIFTPTLILNFRNNNAFRKINILPKSRGRVTLIAPAETFNGPGLRQQRHICVNGQASLIH